MLIPHGIALFFLSIASMFVSFIAWWIVLFTAKFPQTLFDFQVGFLRWNQRVSLYMMYLTQEYPPFGGEADKPANI